MGEGWGTGQGGTLHPLTAERVRRYSEQWIGARLRFAPYQSEIRDRDEYWLVDGITSWYSWKAAAVVGLVSENELEREFASSYAQTLHAGGIERNLERMYQSSASRQIPSRILAPVVLIQVDRALRRPPRSTSLDSVLSEMFRGREARSLWQTLPKNDGIDWRKFRADYVQGTLVASINDILPLAPTLLKPSPPRGAPNRKVTLVFTGKTHGYLENCGCKLNQSGGIARRVTALRRIRSQDLGALLFGIGQRDALFIDGRHLRTRVGPRSQDLGALLFDAGNAFVNVGTRDAPDFLTRKEESFYLKEMEGMHYDAAAVGMTELVQGIEHFRGTMRAIRVPYVGSNLTLEAGLGVASSRIIHRAGLRIGVLGIFEPPAGPRASLREANALSSMTVDDPLITLQREVPLLRKNADLVVILGSLSPVTIRRAVEVCPDVDVIVSTEYEVPSIVFGDRRATLREDDAPGFLGRTLILYTNLENYGIQVAHLELDPSLRVTSARFEDCWLRQDVPDDPGVRRALDTFYANVGRMAETQASVEPLFGGDHSRMTGRYVGAKQCEGCHSVEYKQWKGTKHASAYKTLLDVHRHYQPRCVLCHVVGFGTQHGYRLGDREEPLGNVQCEVCHGPGHDHVANPSRGNITRAVPQAVCLQCHNPDHSDNFVFSEKIPHVRHLE